MKESVFSSLDIEYRALFFDNEHDGFRNRCISEADLCCTRHGSVLCSSREPWLAVASFDSNLPKPAFRLWKLGHFLDGIKRTKIDFQYGNSVVEAWTIALESILDIKCRCRNSRRSVVMGMVAILSPHKTAEQLGKERSNGQNTFLNRVNQFVNEWLHGTATHFYVTCDT